MSSALRGPAVVTGAGGGLGRAIADALADRGVQVVGVDIAGGDERLDVTDPGACRALAERVRPRIWVNNAGVLGAGHVLEQSDDEIRRVVDVNLLGVIHGTRAAADSMRTRGGGRILNVASLASWVAVPGEAVYAATKHAVRAFTTSAAAELRGTGVSLRILCPDGIWTPMLVDRLADPHAAASFTGRRLLTATEVAEAAVRLLEAERLLASVPRWRGAQLRVLGIAPSVTLRLAPLFLALGARNQRRLHDRSNG